MRTRLFLAAGLALSLASGGCGDPARDAGGGGGSLGVESAAAGVDAPLETVPRESSLDLAVPSVPAVQVRPPLAPPPSAVEPVDVAPVREGEAFSPAADPASYVAPVFERPEEIRGLYLNAWGAGSRGRSNRMIDLVRRTEVNTLVIDIKDVTGYLSHRSNVRLANEIGATGELRIPDLPDLLTRLSDAGIYPIARIVVTKDPLLARARPDLAIQDTAGGAWVDQKGISWLNPFQKEVWDYHVAVAREVALLGFPEIQWDYVRFPDAPESFMDRTAFPGADGRSQAEGIRGFLRYSRDQLAPLGVAVTADVFGVTTSFNNDVGIGQLWESFIDVVDAALPMIYPSHYFTGSYGYRVPNAYPYEVVGQAVRDAVRRSAEVEGAGTVRPWLQDFTLGSPRYEAPEVRAQIQAVYDAGVREWILWNPGSRYTEGALLPAHGPGRDHDPLIRVNGEIVPASRRFNGLEPDVDVSADTTQVAGVGTTW